MMSPAVPPDKRNVISIDPMQVRHMPGLPDGHPLHVLTCPHQYSEGTPCQLTKAMIRNWVAVKEHELSYRPLS